MLKFIMIRDILFPMKALDVGLSARLIESATELRKYRMLELIARMTRQPRIPSRGASFQICIISDISGYRGTSYENVAWVTEWALRGDKIYTWAFF